MVVYYRPRRAGVISRPRGSRAPPPKNRTRPDNPANGSEALFNSPVVLRNGPRRARARFHARSAARFLLRLTETFDRYI